MGGEKNGVRRLRWLGAAWKVRHGGREEGGGKLLLCVFAGGGSCKRGE